MPSIAEAIRAVGARVTPARLAVLELLRGAVHPVSHAELEAALSRGPLHVDRVTLYRVLDWLVATGLAHRAADARGLLRFTAATPRTEHAAHAHFRCIDCGGVFCIDAPAPTPPKLPKGFRLAAVELDVRGECADCASQHR